MKVANKDICSMDQEHRNSEKLHGTADPRMDYDETITEAHAEAFYFALKLALARLKHYSAAITG